MSVFLRDLLDRVPADVERRVRSTRDRSRNVLREAIRAECRFSMRTDYEESGVSAQVSVDVVAGYPESLGAITFPDELRFILLLSQHRRALAETVSGTAGLRRLYDELSNLPSNEAWTDIDPGAIGATGHWANELLKRLEVHDPLGKVLAVNEDILGAYFYRADIRDEFGTNAASIAMYWCVIGLVSDWLGCSVEDLTVVVLAHELAHAYTQLGADIDGRRWPSWHFAKAETSLKEGLAQYYTARALERVSHRFPGAFGAFELLLKKQPAAYHTHEPWREECSPEAVRRAMIEVRRSNQGQLDQFQGRLANASVELGPI
jgi:hypothetical protein